MALKKIRVAINGFGRIGRTITRQILSPENDVKFELVHINDIAPLDVCAYLLRFDSTYGVFNGVIGEGAQSIEINGRTIPFTAHQDISDLDLSGVDVLLECSGTVKNNDIAQRGLVAGAKNVLISGPAEKFAPTIIMGANEEMLGTSNIVSNGSCTTNAIAPLLKLLDGELAIERGHVSTIHCYTNSQPMIDAPRDAFARSRAGALSMVPTTTSATKLVEAVLPNLTGRITGAAIRVPTASVSAIDAVLQFSNSLPDDLIAWLKAKTSGSAILATTDDQLVSSDLRARPESLIIALPETQKVGDYQLRLLGWYDNEWGFSARMLNVATLMGAR